MQHLLDIAFSTDWLVDSFDLRYIQLLAHWLVRTVCATAFGGFTIWYVAKVSVRVA